MANIFQTAMQMMKNPQQFLGNMGIPQNIMNDPNAILQYGLNNGRFTQQQYNQAKAQLQQMQNDPQFKSLFGK